MPTVVENNVIKSSEVTQITQTVIKTVPVGKVLTNNVGVNRTANFKVSNITTQTSIVAVQRPINPKDAGLDGRRYIFSPFENETVCPVWYLPIFLDLFADSYKKKIMEKDPNLNIPAVKRIGYAFKIVHKALSFIAPIDQIVDGMNTVISAVTYALQDGFALCDQLPAQSNDNEKFYTFLISFMMKIKAMHIGDGFAIPTSWANQEGIEHAVILYISKDSENTGEDYSITIINSGSEAYKGLSYHPSNIDPSTGSVLKCLSLELTKANSDRISNTAFWYRFFLLCFLLLLFIYQLTIYIVIIFFVFCL
jgi:hypothetical protein